MSTLGSIRKRSTLLLSVIGLAMLAFILGDFMQSKRSGGSGGIFVGKVADEEISIQAFEARVQKGTENWKASNPNSTLNQGTMSQIRISIWDEYIKELIMDVEFEELGINVDSEEMFELFQGNNVHPEISKIQIFQDPNTKQFDRAKIIQYMKNIENEQNAEAREQWLGYEKYIRTLRKNEKYNSLVEQGMYVSSAEARTNFNESNANISFEYVPVSYSFIADSLVDISEAEIKTYYKKNISQFQQDESRDVKYVVYAVLPSGKDDEDTKNNLDAITETFTAYEDYEVFVRRNTDNNNAIFNFVKEDAILDTNVTSLFSDEKGAVIGPYKFSKTTYRVSKLTDIQYRPDSVEARHILISPTQAMSIDSVNKKIEALKLSIEKGADFGEVARKESEDKGSAIKGGDLGWFKEGAMVAEFNDICFTAERGKLTIVQSQFGVHLIEVTDKSKKVKKVKIAYIDRVVEPSSETYHNYYTQAAQFAGALLNTDTTTFDDLADANNLIKRDEAKVIPSKQDIPSLKNSRAMVRWMYNANIGDISEVFEFGNSYVVATLTKINQEGDISLEDIKEQVTAIVKKQKKGKIIIEKINSESFSTLTDLATRMNSQIQIASKVNFLNNQIQNLGNEPQLLGMVSSSETNEIIEAIEGENAIFVAKVISRNEVRDSGDFSKQKKQMFTTIIRNASASVYNALKEDAEVIDNRNDFY